MITAPPSLVSGSSTEIIKRVENFGSFAWLDDDDTVKAKKTAKLIAFFTILIPFCAAVGNTKYHLPSSGKRLHLSSPQ